MQSNKFAMLPINKDADTHTGCTVPYGRDAKTTCTHTVRFKSTSTNYTGPNSK